MLKIKLFLLEQFLNQSQFTRIPFQLPLEVFLHFQVLQSVILFLHLNRNQHQLLYAMTTLLHFHGYVRLQVSHVRMPALPVEDLVQVNQLLVKMGLQEI